VVALDYLGETREGWNRVEVITVPGWPKQNIIQFQPVIIDDESFQSDCSNGVRPFFVPVLTTHGALKRGPVRFGTLPLVQTDLVEVVATRGSAVRQFRDTFLDTFLKRFLADWAVAFDGSAARLKKTTEVV